MDEVEFILQGMDDMDPRYLFYILRVLQWTEPFEHIAPLVVDQHYLDNEVHRLGTLQINYRTARQYNRLALTDLHWTPDLTLTQRLWKALEAIIDGNYPGLIHIPFPNQVQAINTPLLRFLAVLVTYLWNCLGLEYMRVLYFNTMRLCRQLHHSVTTMGHPQDDRYVMRARIRLTAYKTLFHLRRIVPYIERAAIVWSPQLDLFDQINRTIINPDTSNVAYITPPMPLVHLIQLGNLINGTLRPPPGYDLVPLMGGPFPPPPPPGPPPPPHAL